jgi:hypothetical protein
MMPTAAIQEPATAPRDRAEVAAGLIDEAPDQERGERDAERGPESGDAGGARLRRQVDGETGGDGDGGGD